MVRGERHGFEFKYSDAPGHTRSMSVAIQDLKLEHLWVNEQYKAKNQDQSAPATLLLS